ncbi:MAG: DUF4340 domain-containing protein [Oscillospiraceae bacterium]|nr:DUF4340 domain-containing protein [Oscillospiraceae bacterium]
MKKEYFTDNLSVETLAKLTDKMLNFEKNAKNRSLKTNLLKIIPAIAAIVLVIGGINLLPAFLNNTEVVPGNEDNEPTTEVLNLMSGESIGPCSAIKIFITDPVDKKDIKSVYVKNQSDKYTVIHNLGYDIFYVEGAELAPINPENLSSFFTNVDYLLGTTRVAAKDVNGGNKWLSDFSQFGFNDDSAYFVVTKTDDTYYKIIISDKIPTTGGYYLMYEDANGLRPTIYITTAKMELNVLNTRYSLLQPLICQPIPINELYKINNFEYCKGADKFVEIYNAPIPEGSEVLVNRQMKYPAPYTVSDNYNSLLSTFTNFVGIRVVYSFPLNEDISEDILTQYGFDQYTTKITFDYNGENYNFIFSKPDDAGNYYVISMEFGTIVEVKPNTVPFLTWDLFKFVDKPIFSQNINDVTGITVKVPGKPDVVFTINGTEQDMIVYANGTALDCPNPVKNVEISDDKAWNFRQYYKSILSIDLWDYETDVSKDENPMLEIIVNMKNGDIMDYKFYIIPINTMRCFFTLNGDGNFYVLKDKITKLIADTDLVMQNIPT